MSKKLPALKSPPEHETNDVTTLHDEIEETPIPSDVEPSITKVAKGSTGGDRVIDEENPKMPANNDFGKSSTTGLNSNKSQLTTDTSSDTSSRAGPNSKNHLAPDRSHEVDDAFSEDSERVGYEVYTPGQETIQMEPTPMETDQAFQKEKLWNGPRLILLSILLSLVCVAVALGIALSQKDSSSDNTPGIAVTEDNFPSSIPTASPTTSPTIDISSCVSADAEYNPSDRFVSIRSDLVENGVTTVDADFDVPFSPQREALCWLADADNFGLERSPSLMVQRYILTVFYHSVFTEGVELTNWLHSNKDECTWQGITCEPSEGGVVIGLELKAEELGGELIDELGGLKDLKKLNLEGNKINGTIPQQLVNLTKLEYLSLSYNRLEGNLPKEMDQLDLLKELELRSNGLLNGTIPIELGSLTNLEELFLGYNSFSGLIPVELGGLLSVKVLELENNELEGPIPVELASLPNLKTLYLSGNQLNSTIPEEFGNTPNLTRLEVGFTKLSGTIENDSGICNIANIYADCDDIYFKCTAYEGLVCTNQDTSVNGHGQ